LLGKRTASWRLALGGGSAGMRGRKAQQWYAYDSTRLWTRGKCSGDGNSRKLGLLNVLRCSSPLRPRGGSTGNRLLPKFLVQDKTCSILI
jgi:hypothetical protein